MISATRVPVLTATGDTIYKNVSVSFDVDADGNLALTPEFPKVADSPALAIFGFLAGKYVGPGSLLAGKATAVVSGPGVLPGGATSWSLTAGPDAADCTYPASATWYVGPLTNSPVAARLKSAEITSTAWSYGVAGNSPCSSFSSASNHINAYWRPGSLIGVSQTGNAVTLASFSFISSPTDRSAPVDQITYRLGP